jgi:hypothetical protein
MLSSQLTRLRAYSRHIALSPIAVTARWAVSLSDGPFGRFGLVAWQSCKCWYIKLIGEGKRIQAVTAKY